SPATILGVLRTPRLGIFFVASVVVWTSHAALQGFVSLRVKDLGGDATTVAATWSLGAVIEVFLMSAFPALARRFGAEPLIVGGAIGGVFGLPVLFGIAAVGYTTGAILTWVAIARRRPAAEPRSGA